MKKQYVTIQQDLMGHLHVWLGRPAIYQSGKYLYKTVKGDWEAEVYLQAQSDVEAILELLPKHTVESIKGGYLTITTKFPIYGFEILSY